MKRFSGLYKNPKTVIVAISFIVGGCSTINSILEGSGDTLPAGAFRGTAAIRHQTVPLPVDIAENILAIENGQLVTGDPNLDPQEDNAISTPVVNSPAPIQQAENVPLPEKTHPLSGRKIWSRNRARYPAKRSIKPYKKGTQTLRYNVKNGDTLMKIAFAKYGDIFRWRDIYKDNKNTIANYNKLVIGSTLVLNGVPFIVIEKNGEPYLIRRGDTLIGISKKLYNSPRYWSALWKNNTQLIRNPNKIYAGFTIYYRPKSEVIPGLRQPTSSSEK